MTAKTEGWVLQSTLTKDGWLCERCWHAAGVIGDPIWVVKETGLVCRSCVTYSEWQRAQS